jgi:hypothetical protein
MAMSDYFTSQPLYLSEADIIQLDIDNKQKNGSLGVGGFME